MKKYGITAAVLISSLVMMGIGVYRGEVEMLFQKAIVICLECIGLG